MFSVINMYTRFRDSIVFPRNIVDFRNDSLIKVFLYIIFFALLLSTSTILFVISFDGTSGSTQEMIKQNFEVMDSTCEIDEAVYNCDTNKNQLFYEDTFFSFYFDSRTDLVYDDYKNIYNFVISDDTLYLIFNRIELFTVKLADLPITWHNIDFNEQTTDIENFNIRIFAALDDALFETHNLWGPGLIISDLLGSFVLFMLFILISSWMLKLRFKPIRYKQLFTMSAYSGTALFLILIFNSLVNLDFFIVIILLFVAIRQNNQLGVEIMRRTLKKP